MRRVFLLFRALPLLLLLCLSVPLAAAAATVAVTLPPLAGIVAMLDEKAQVTCLLPAAADPHHFQLQPRKVEQLNRAGLLLRASADDGGWPLPPSHSNTLDLWPDRDHGWLSPAEVRAALPRVARALATLHPERRSVIEQRLTHAINQTEALETAWRETLLPLKDSGVLMQHPAWRRLMQEMGVPVLAVMESGHHGHEHGPHAVDAALNSLNAHPDALLLHDAAHVNRTLDWLESHAGKQVRKANLDALGSCGMRWDLLTQKNLDSIRAALQP